jgi:phage tail-like protein
MSDRSKTDPYRAFRFAVERGKVEIGGFSQVAGLSRETSVEEYREGGENGYVHKLANVAKYGNITLKRGLTKNSDLWAWHQDVLVGDISLEDLDVVLRDERGEDRWRWTVTRAYPVKWTGTDLDASQANIFVESIEFAHQGVIGHAV